MIIILSKKAQQELEGEFDCLGKNPEKHKNFSAPIKTEVKKSDKNGEKIMKMIYHKLQFIPSARFIACLPYNLVDNLAEETHKNE